MKNTIGNGVSFTLFGESHGPAVGGVLDGLSAGIPLDMQALDAFLEKRRPGKSPLATARKEQDRLCILSGVKDGFTTGTPLAFMLENTDARSKDYAAIPARPGHADWAARQKYAGFEDGRGGGHFSGRLTAPLTAAGGICLQVLQAKGVSIGTHIHRLGAFADTPFSQEPAELMGQLSALGRKTGLPVLSEEAGRQMEAAIAAAAKEGDSVGGVLETAVTGLIGGVGEPFFDTVEGVLAHLVFAIPGVKGVEFGLGFGFGQSRGSAANDALCIQNGSVYTATNNSGGINGGISNGMPVLLRAAYRPTPSIRKAQPTVDLDRMEPVMLELSGRHDPCILPRAAVVQTAACALGLLDLCTQRFGTLWQRPF